MDHFDTVFLQAEEIWKSLCSSAFVKSVWAVLISGFSFCVGVENYSFLQYLGLLIIIDLLTGIGSAIKHGKSIESRKVFKTATKAVVYLLFVAAAHLTVHTVPASDFIVIGVVSFLGLTEFFSIMENIAKMGYQTPKKLLNQKDIMKMVERTAPRKRKKD
jgi:toxin secretion/phage lysis holin